MKMTTEEAMTIVRGEEFHWYCEDGTDFEDGDWEKVSSLMVEHETHAITYETVCKYTPDGTYWMFTHYEGAGKYSEPEMFEADYDDVSDTVSVTPIQVWPNEVTTTQYLPTEPKGE